MQLGDNTNQGGKTAYADTWHRILPRKKIYDLAVEGGGHFMICSRADEISEMLIGKIAVLQNH